MSNLHRVVGPCLWACFVCSFSGCAPTRSIPSVLPGGPLGEAPAPFLEVGTEALALRETDNSLRGYQTYAIAQSPRVQAAFEKWRAAKHGVGKSGRLPDPTIAFGYYLRSVETRVGPQNYSINVSQTIPWLGKLAADQSAAGARADAEALVTDAEVLAVRRDVGQVYWTLWLIAEEHRLRAEHDVLLEALSGAVRGRLQTGSATLADLNQVDLNIARHHDHRGAHEQALRQASSRLVSILGAAPRMETVPVSDSPGAGLPLLSDQELFARARHHPRIGRFGHLAKSEAHNAGSAAGDRYPKFMVGVNLIGTGEAGMPGVADSGKDALVVSAGLSLPIWGRSYSDAEASANAASASHRAMAASASREAEAEVASVLAGLRDSQRRLRLYQSTLIPQAELTVRAVLGGYQVKSSTVAAVILAQRDLIDLQIELARARAAHAQGKAQLEYLVGTTLEFEEPSNE